MTRPRTTPYPPVTGAEPCREIPEAFFPEPGDNKTAQLAKATCRRCPVVNECAAWAIDQGWHLFGVFGGLTQAQRERIRRGRVAS